MNTDVDVIVSGLLERQNKKLSMLSGALCLIELVSTAKGSLCF